MKLFGKKNDAQTPADTGGDEAFDSAGMEAADGADGFDESHDDIENAAENGGDKQLMAPSRKISGAGGNRKTIMLGGGLVAVIALLGGGYYFMAGSSTPEAPVQVTASAPASATPAAADATMPPQPAPAAAVAAVPNTTPAAPAAVPAATAADPFAAPAATVPGAAPAALGMPPSDEKGAIPASQVANGATPVTAAPEETAPDMPAPTLSSPQVPLTTAAAVATPATAKPAAGDLPMPAATGMDSAAAKPADAKAVVKPADTKPGETEAAPAWAAPGAAAVPGTTAAAGATKTSSPSDAELAIVQNSAVLDQLTQPAKPAAAAAAGASNMPFDPNAPKPPVGDAMKSVEQILEQQAIIRPVPNGYVTVRKEADTTDMDSRLVAARTALGENRNAAALQLFDSLHTDYPKDKRIAMGRAVALQKTGQTDSALNAYEDVLNHDPKNLQALTNMLGLLKAKDPQLALEKLVQLHEAYPYQPDVAAQLGVAYGSTGNYPDAAKYLDLADALKPGSAFVMYNRAVLYDKMGKVQQAGDLYRQIIGMSADGTLDQPLPIDTIRARLSTLR
ncbi:MAG: tetratricopeptide repeat protein [Micavibrio sp.]|nr:tetratricopeptide repeat protein [Micavibrio sp.]